MSDTNRILGLTLGTSSLVALGYLGWWWWVRKDTIDIDIIPDTHEEQDITNSETHWNFAANAPVPEDWNIRHFSPEDLKSRGNNRVVANKQALRALDRAAHRAQQYGHPPIRLTNQVRSDRNGAYRDPIWNARQGGASNSRHMFGDGFDIWTQDHNASERLQLLKNLYAAGFRGYGHGVANIHVDTGKKRRWRYGKASIPQWNTFDGSQAV